MSSIKHPFWADGVFLLSLCLFCLCAYLGNQMLSPMGVNMDSDLQYYAEILESRAHPEVFTTDPVVPLFSHEPGVPNMLTRLTCSVFPTGHAPTNLLRMGTIIIFAYFLSFYILGRWLFAKPSLAALLTLVMAITVYWAYGTFWGNLHSDPVPRHVFAVLWPLLLILACMALDSFLLQAITMFLTGSCIMVHTVSTLMCGPMFLVAFFLARKHHTWRIHLGRAIVNGTCFILPVTLYLWWLLSVMIQTPHDASLFNEVRMLRFESDFSHIWLSLRDILWHYCMVQPILPAGFLCGHLLYRRKHMLPDRIQQLLTLAIGMTTGIILMCFVCAAEISICNMLGKNNFSQEILRGTRFLIPISWLMIATAIAIFVWPRWSRMTHGVIVTVLALAMLCFMPEKQIQAGRHYAASLTGIASLDTPLAKEMQRKSQLQLEALNALHDHAHDGELVFNNDDLMAIRYVAHCNMLPVHKDGNIIYYAKQSEPAKRWLSIQHALKTHQDGWISVWLREQAPLLFTNHVEARERLLQYGEVLFSNEDWLIMRKLPVPSQVAGSSSTKK